MIATRTLIFTGIAAAFLSGMSSAETTNQGYLVDSRGNIVTSPFTGTCWHTHVWTPELAVEPCDPIKKTEAPAPKVAAVAPPPQTTPAPQAAPAPVKAPPHKINFSADALFDFDKAVLKPEGKTMLDDLARQLDGAQYELILATGHTDRFGSAEYNQNLSMRRANAVKDYLTVISPLTSTSTRRCGCRHAISSLRFFCSHFTPGTGCVLPMPRVSIFALSTPWLAR